MDPFGEYSVASSPAWVWERAVSGTERKADGVERHWVEQVRAKALEAWL